MIPADFIILEIEEDLEISILFGRPFFMTAGAIIDMRKGKITLEVDNKHMEFDVFKIISKINNITTKILLNKYAYLCYITPKLPLELHFAPLPKLPFRVFNLAGLP